MWQKLQTGWKPPKVVTEEDYKLIKQYKDDYPYLSGFVGFGCSFSGIWFSGYAKCNRGDDYCGQAYRSTLKKMENLKTAKFLNKDFSELDFENSLIYCDPPYRNTSPYNKEVLGIFDYDKFLEWVKWQSSKNIVLVSEYKHNLPEGAKIVLEIKSNQEIRGKEGRKETTEILFTFNNL